MRRRKGVTESDDELMDSHQAPHGDSKGPGSIPSGLVYPEPAMYGTPPQALEHEPQQNVRIIATPIGIYGWRKYCLYASVLFLVALSIVNLGLLVWLANVLELKDDHAGPLYFGSDRLQVRGRAEFTEGLAVNTLSGFDGAALRLESNRQISLTASTEDGSAPDMASTLLVDQGETVLTTPALRAAARDANGTVQAPYFEASANSVVLRANEVRVASASGLAIEGSLQASRISNVFAQGQGLTLESAGQDLTLQADRDLTLASSNGRLTLSSLLDLGMNAGEDLVLAADQRLRLLDLPTPTADAGAAQFQLCMCAADQRVYRVAASSTCAAGAAAVGC